MIIDFRIYLIMLFRHIDFGAPSVSQLLLHLSQSEGATYLFIVALVKECFSNLPFEG